MSLLNVLADLLLVHVWILLDDYLARLQDLLGDLVMAHHLSLMHALV